MFAVRGLFKLLRTRQTIVAGLVILCLGTTGFTPARPVLFSNQDLSLLDPTPSPPGLADGADPASASTGDLLPPFAASPGAIDAPLTIPGRSPANIDGSCFGREYRDGVAANFIDGNGATGTVYLKHDQNNLYICMIGAVGSYDQRFASVYLDPNLNRGAFPQPDDLAFRANLAIPGTSALKGGGAPGYYIPVSLSGWKAAANVSFVDAAEFQIPLAFVGCGSAFGLAIYHHWFGGVSNDYGWPASQFWDQPQTWAVVSLDAPNTQGCTYFPVMRR